MTAITLLSILVQISFISLGFLTVKDFILYKDKTRRDIALMFASLALTYVIPNLAPIIGMHPKLSGFISTAALVAQPYLLLRLVQYFHPVSKRLHRAALIGLIASWLALALADIFSKDLATLLGLIIIGYFAAINGYGMVTLIRCALRTSGVVRQRLRFAAVGSGLLGLALIWLALGALIPLMNEVFTILIGVTAITAAICYYIGFSPPRPLRRMWQLAEFRDFLLRLSSKPIGERLNITETLAELGHSANLAVGGFLAAVVQRDETEAGWLLQHSSDPSAAITIPADNPTFIRMWLERIPTIIRTSDPTHHNEHFILKAVAADTLLVAPIVTTQHNSRLLLIFLKHPSLFVQDDLELIVLLAQQSAIFLENGTLVENLHQHSDELEKRVAERTLALEESQKEYVRIVETAQEGIWTVDADNKTTFVNTKLVDMLGYSLEEFLTLPTSTFMDEESQAIAAVKSEQRRQGIIEQFELKLQHKNGTDLYVLISSTPLVDDHGQYIGALAMLADITARKQAEDAVHKLNAELEQRVAERTSQLTAVNGELEAFSYSVSHDLRAPLRALDGFSQALQEDYAHALDADGLDFLKRIRAASQRMGQLIDDLLALSQLTRAEMRHEPLNISKLAQQIVNEICESQPNRTVNFVIQPDLMVRGDNRLLRLMLVNLLNNAWKFTSKTSDARIEFGLTSKDDRQVYFVRDNGAGFDMAYANKLFGAFQRLHKATEFEGTGIGLAIVQRVIHRHGGHVWAEGALSQGATFYFSL